MIKVSLSLIWQVSNKLYQLNYVSETIEQYAKNMLLSAVDYTSDFDASGSIGSRREVSRNLMSPFLDYS